MERTPQRDEKGMLDFCEHAALVVCVLDLLHLDDLGFLQDLDGVEALVVLGLYEVDAAETARSECSLNVEVGQGILALGGRRISSHRPGAISHLLDAGLLDAAILMWWFVERHLRGR